MWSLECATHSQYKESCRLAAAGEGEVLYGLGSATQRLLHWLPASCYPMFYKKFVLSSSSCLLCDLACCGLRSTARGCFCAGWLMLGLRSIAGSRRPVLLLRWVVKWGRRMASVLH